MSISGVISNPIIL